MCARVFEIKLKELMDVLRSPKIFKGSVVYLVSVIEFQKRGLPHAHIVLKKTEPMTLEYIDSVVSAEIPPETSPALRQLVIERMIHGPHDGASPCLDPETKGCTKNFPKATNPATYTDERGYVIYKRRGLYPGTTKKHGKTVVVTDNDVVPHNRQLVLYFGAHINVEVAATVQVIKYLFK